MKLESPPLFKVEHPEVKIHKTTGGLTTRVRPLTKRVVTYNGKTMCPIADYYKNGDAIGESICTAFKKAKIIPILKV